MYMVVLGVLLLILKLAEFGPVGQWSYWAVLWPFALAVIWWSYADSSGWNKRREIEKMEERKKSAARTTWKRWAWIREAGASAERFSACARRLVDSFELVEHGAGTRA